MKLFKDAQGRDWTIEINLDCREQVKAATDLDFLDVQCVEKLADLATLGAVLSALCAAQIEKRGLSAREFAAALRGDAFDSAREALEQELCDFFPKGRRLILSKALAKARQIEQMALDQAEQILDSGKIEQSMRRRLNELSGGLPASSESTPAA